METSAACQRTSTTIPTAHRDHRAGSSTGAPEIKVRVVVMERKLWTAAEMEKLTRTEQQAIFDDSIVADLDDVPAEFLARVRADAERLIATRGTSSTD